MKPKVFSAHFRSGEGCPVVIRGAIPKSKLWTLQDCVHYLGPDTQLQARFYQGTVRTPERWTQVGYCDPRPITAPEYADMVQSGRAKLDDVYVNCDVKRSGAGAVFEPELARLGKALGLEVTKTLGPMVNLWWGAPGHTEPLHSDINDGTLFQLRGRKRIVLFPASEWVNLYPFPTTAEMSWSWSRVNLDKIDTCSFPRIKGALARRMEFVLEEGDALFIPAAWAHEITGIDD